MLNGKMFRLGTEQRVCGQGDDVVIPGGTEQAWFREDTEVIDFFAPPGDDFLLGKVGIALCLVPGLSRCSRNHPVAAASASGNWS